MSNIIDLSGLNKDSVVYFQNYFGGEDKGTIEDYFQSYRNEWVRYNFYSPEVEIKKLPGRSKRYRVIQKITMVFLKISFLKLTKKLMLII